MAVYEIKLSKPVSYTDATVGVTIVKNPVASTFHFNGDSRLELPYTPVFDSNGLTGGRIEVTFNPDALTANNQYIVDEVNSAFRIFHNRTTNNRWRARIFNVLNIDNTTAQDALEHVHVISWNSGLKDFFVDAKNVQKVVDYLGSINAIRIEELVK